MLWTVLFACQTPPTPSAPPAVVVPPPVRPAPSTPAAPPWTVERVDGAAPMEVLVQDGPAGDLPQLSLLMASRGDGEIEPCG